MFLSHSPFSPWLELVDSFCMTFLYHNGNLCRLNISVSRRSSTESYALATSTQAMFRFRLPRCASLSTIQSISKLWMVPLHFSLAPRWSPCISPCSLTCLFAWPNKQGVYHLYCVLKHVMGIWFSLLNFPGLGIRLVLLAVNHNGNCG